MVAIDEEKIKEIASRIDKNDEYDIAKDLMNVVCYGSKPETSYGVGVATDMFAAKVYEEKYGVDEEFEDLYYKCLDIIDSDDVNEMISVLREGRKRTKKYGIAFTKNTYITSALCALADRIAADLTYSLITENRGEDSGEEYIRKVKEGWKSSINSAMDFAHIAAGGTAVRRLEKVIDGFANNVEKIRGAVEAIRTAPNSIVVKNDDVGVTILTGHGEVDEMLRAVRSEYMERKRRIRDAVSEVKSIINSMF